MSFLSFSHASFLNGAFSSPRWNYHNPYFTSPNSKSSFVIIADFRDTRNHCILYLFSSVQSLCRVQLFATPWTAARQASLSITNSWSLLKLMSIESVMPANHFIVCCPLLLLPSVFPSIRVFSNESAVRIRQPKYWSFSFNISPSSEYAGLISFRMD